jgi:protein-tyrosine phosphatase
MISFFQRSNYVNDMAWLGVDMHNHILPGIDDGAANAAHSVHFIKTLSNLGFDQFICTPHIFTDLYPNTAQTIASALAEVETALAMADICIKISAAAEYMVDDTFRVKENLICLPGKYLLMEIPYLAEIEKMDQLIFELQIKGFKVIFAHPERYSFYYHKLDRYFRLKQMGVLFQLNLLSLNGYYGKTAKFLSNYLLKKEWYDFAGTDIHHHQHLNEIQLLITKGYFHKTIGSYPFKNQELFKA